MQGTWKCCIEIATAQEKSRPGVQILDWTFNGGRIQKI